LPAASARGYRRRVHVLPIYDLRILTPRLELRLPDTALLEELVTLAAKGVHPPDVMPFDIPWTDRPSPQMEREAIQYHLLQVAKWSPEEWTYNPVVIHEGRVIGSQGIGAESFAQSRSVHTGSWLGHEFQGRGLGRERRAAILHLAFQGLGAQEALSGAFQDNPASIAVSRSLGYEENGTGLIARRGSPAIHIGLRLTREKWLSRPRLEVSLEGLDGCLDLFGAGAD
jgi:RimJ/RimL family protein N-acetyltransferase